MLPFLGAPAPRGFLPSPGAPPPRPMMVPPPGVPALGLPPRGMPPPRPTIAPFVINGAAPPIIPSVPGPRGLPSHAAPGTTSNEQQQDPGPVHVFVGKLPPDLHDNYIRRLLETCGTIASWQRTSDPVTNKPKGFGFCTYTRTLDVLRALRLLDGFTIDSQRILLKVDSKKLEKLDAFEKALPKVVRVEEKAADERVRQTLRAIYEGQNGVEGGQASIGGLVEGKGSVGNEGNGVDPDMTGAGGDTRAGDEAVDSDTGEAGGSESPGTGKVSGKRISSEIEKFRSAQKERNQELERKRADAVRDRMRQEREQEQKAATPEKELSKQGEEAAPKTSEGPETKVKQSKRPEPNGAVDADKRNDASRERGRDGSSPRKPDSKPIDRREKARSRGRSSGRQRRSRSRSLEKRGHQSGSRRHRHRHGSRGGGRSISRSRSGSRSRRRPDRHRSKRRSRSQSRRRGDQRRRRMSSDADGSHTSDARERSSERKRRRRSSTSSEKMSENRRSRSPRADRSDRSNRHGSANLSSVEEGQEKSKVPAKPSIKELPKVVLGLKLQSNATKKEKPSPIVSVPLAFGVDDEVAVKPKREIVPIDYTDEAQAPSSAGRSSLTTEHVDANKLKALIERIPTDRDALFAFPIDWAVVDAQGLVERKMRAWTGKKMLEYLGEEEPAMVDFVLAKLREHVRPQAILDELRQVLEDEADMFVALLWRKLAFEAARANLL